MRGMVKNDPGSQFFDPGAIKLTWEHDFFTWEYKMDWIVITKRIQNKFPAAR